MGGDGARAGAAGKRLGWSLIGLSAIGTVAGWRGFKIPLELESTGHALIGMAALILGLVGCGFMFRGTDERTLLPDRAAIAMGGALLVSTLLVVTHN